MRTVIVTPSERRKAEQFDAAIEGRADAAEEDTLPVAVAGWLRSIEVGGAVDPAYRDRLRTRLMAVASVQGLGADAAARSPRSERQLRRKPPKRRLPRRIALLGGTMAALVALSGVGAASNDAVPGDALYSVKRSREAAQLALARSDVSRGQLHLQFARTRLTEATTVSGDASELRRVLADMDADTRTGMRALSGAAVERQDRAPLDALDEFATVQRRQLIGLIGALPEQRRLHALDSLTLLEQVRERSGGLRPSLLCTSGYAGAGRSDELGPLPRRCAALPEVGPSGPIGPGGLTGTQTPLGPAGPQTNPRSSVSATPSTLPVPAVPGVPGLPGELTEPGLPGELTEPGKPGDPEPTAGQPSEPSPTPSGATQGLLGDVTDTVGGVVGSVLDPLTGGGSP